MTAAIGFVIVSHSKTLAQGVAELAGQMAPDVRIAVAGGREDEGLGTSFDLIDQRLTDVLSQCEGAVVLTDIGSATLTAESVIEFRDDQDRIALADAPLVEGAVAAAVAAQQGGDLKAVAQAAHGAAHVWNGHSQETVTEGRSVIIADKSGLHARPAAALARLAASFEADIMVDGVDAKSIIGLMSLGRRQGDTVVISATGPDAEKAITEIGDAIVAGFED
ncbi:HPr family phosphocarrier protein [Actinomycetaceae bacterium WB03_NA08]|uniref:Phosphocarrier protein HPr n=1 Tax=Scrofimicrobium canadense TaxID=2652290 RepID=A0A6N7W5S6_9ACTO|nr:dihydroxyacetone kinase phosphoryl donor subunit DhaM [Scrofimicrobium canadense]MSS83566.1 HPr family phosphocarrier protein [Scrofimicrobium canadense]